MTVDWTWAYELLAIGAATTRLTLRVRATFQPWWVRLIYDGMIVPSDFIMARSMLRGLSRRAEGRLSRGDLDDAGRRETRVHDPVAAESRTAGGAPSGPESEARRRYASHWSGSDDPEHPGPMTLTIPARTAQSGVTRR
jgi:hypothetical protein